MEEQTLQMCFADKTKVKFHLTHFFNIKIPREQINIINDYQMFNIIHGNKNRFRNWYFIRVEVC